MAKLLIINGSPRKNGSDAKVAAKAAEIASEYGYESERVDVYDLRLNGCMACGACKKTGRCVQKDGMNDLIAKIRDSDMLLLATPVYFGAETGPMKTFIDRLYALTSVDADGNKVRDIGKVKKVSTLFTCGAPEGNMTYANLLAHFVAVFKAYGVTDTSGVVIPAADPATVLDSDYANGYFETLRFQLEH